MKPSTDVGVLVTKVMSSAGSSVELYICFRNDLDDPRYYQTICQIVNRKAKQRFVVLIDKVVNEIELLGLDASAKVYYPHPTEWKELLAIFRFWDPGQGSAEEWVETVKRLDVLLDDEKKKIEAAFREYNNLPRKRSDD